MPELPDVEVFTRNLHKILANRKLLRVKLMGGKNITDSAAAFKKKFAGKRLTKIYRSGKEMRFLFEDGSLMGLHLMLTGDVSVFEKKNEHHSTLAEFYFDDGPGFALSDRMKNAFVKIDPVDKDGVDALSPKFSMRYLQDALQRKTSVKKVLTDQNVIRGIGNSYSDEILWEAKIHPYSVAKAIPREKIKPLLTIIKRRLKEEIKNIAKVSEGKVSGEVKDFMLIHTKKIAKSPTGAKIIIDAQGMMKTYYTKEQKLYR